MDWLLVGTWRGVWGHLNEGMSNSEEDTSKVNKIIRLPWVFEGNLDFGNIHKPSTVQYVIQISPGIANGYWA